MTVERIPNLPPALKSLIKKNIPDDDIGKELFESQYENASFFIVDDNDDKGALVFKYIAINKRKYTNIKQLVASSTPVYKELIKEIISVSDKREDEGIVTDYFPDDDKAIAILDDSKFTPLSKIYGCSVANIKTKTDKGDIVTERYTKGSKRTNAFSELLTKFDIDINKTLNASAKQSVYDVPSKNDRTHSIKISYFLKGIIDDSAWYAFLVLDKNEAIGFIKGKIDNTSHTVLTEIYIEPAHLDEYAGKALNVFVNALPKSVKYLSYVTSENNKSIVHVCEKYFGKALGSSFIRV